MRSSKPRREMPNSLMAYSRRAVFDTVFTPRSLRSRFSQFRARNSAALVDRPRSRGHIRRMSSRRTSKAYHGHSSPKNLTVPFARIFAVCHCLGLGNCRPLTEVIGEAPGPALRKSECSIHGGKIAQRPGEFGSGRRAPIWRSDITALSCFIASDEEH